MFMFRPFQTLPFYAKYGAIPESYLIALSYEEQLLWLCKFITDLDTKLDSTFAEVQEYINSALENIEVDISGKQDKLIAGENISIVDNVISAIFGTNFTDSIDNGKTYGDYNVGETMPTVKTAFEGTACIEIVEGENPVSYKIKGEFDLYEIDSDTREILYKESYETTDNFYDFTTTGGRRMVICWNNTDTNTPMLYKLQDFSSEIQDLQGQIDDINVELSSKQNTLIAGENITISDNVISATGGSNEPVSDLVIDYSSSLSAGTYSDTAVGEILPSAVLFEDTEHIEINEVAVRTYKLIGDFTIYEVDKTTREVLEKVTAMSLTGYDFTTNGDRKLCVCFNTDTIEPKIYMVLTANYINTSINTLNSEMQGKQDTLTAGSGISIVNNVISATGGGGVSVTQLTSDVVLLAGSTTTSLTTGFYDTGGYKVYFHSQTLANEIFGNEIFYYDSSTNTFIGAFQICEYDLIEADWSLIQNDYLENSLSSARNKVPTSYAVSEALGDKIENDTIGTTSSVSAIWTGTQTEYNLLSTYDSSTLYFIKE